MEKPQTPRFYPGWLVAAGCFLATTLEGGLWFSQGLFFKPLAQAFSWSRAETSLANTVFMLAYGVSGVLLSRWADRYGTRNIMFVAAVLVGIGLALNHAVRGLGELLATYAILGV